MAFRSRLEEKVADLLVDLDVKYEYETVKVDYTIAHIYKPDFILPNGVHLECKGYWDKKSKTTYAQYCERIGILWCSFTNIPVAWLM